MFYYRYFCWWYSYTFREWNSEHSSQEPTESHSPDTKLDTKMEEKINKTKSTQINFTLRKEQWPRVSLNGIQIPWSTSTKYLGIHLDHKMNSIKHLTKKLKQVDLKVKEMQWLIGRRSKLSLENNILLYKTIIKLIWVYDIKLWDCASKSNRISQSEILRMITNASWYVSNQTCHEYFNVPIVMDVIKDKSRQYHTKLQNHTKTLLHPLLEQQIDRSLKRNLPIDLKNY